MTSAQLEEYINKIRALLLPLQDKDRVDVLYAMQLCLHCGSDLAPDLECYCTRDD